MLAPLTIPRERLAEPALDQEKLYALGLDHVQRLASRIWTDYNVHDPGVTILELLCYALTDLSYRTTLPVKDLIASASNNADEMKKQFFTARQILPNRPLTLLDYRKLLIDLEGVKNAWLQPAPLSYYADTIEGKLLREQTNLPGMIEAKISGLYDVIVEFMDDVTSAAERTKVLDLVKRQLQANRNLCEDFVSFTEVEIQSFLLCCELELAPHADVASVEAEVFFEMQRYLAPAVANYTLAEMLERRHSDGTTFVADEIFDGPALNCGFIDDEELTRADLRTEIHLSDVIRIIMDITDVRAVKDIVINPEGVSIAVEDKWIVPVASGRKALLNQKKSRLVFYKRNMPVTAAGTELKDRYAELADTARAKAETTAVPLYDFAIPLGQYRQPQSYYSFQNHFPELYGLSEAGLSGVEDDKRKALAFQLKAYLLFFDQVMANYFAQLSQVKELLSIDPGLEQTYFCQVVDSFANYSRIYAADPLASLTQVVEDEDTFADRRNRFVDHLIARFAEQFTDFVHVMASVFGSTAKSMIAFKCDFLKSYPLISSDRSLAYNYTLKQDSDLWNSENVSGLERRLAKLLGMRNFTRRNLSDIAYDIYAEVNKTPDDKFRWRIYEKNTSGVVLSSSTKYLIRELARKEMQTAISLALVPSGYQRKITSSGKHYFNVIDATGEVVGRRIEYFDTSEEMEQAIAELMEYLQANYSDEGMYLIEMILLRPEREDEPFLPICPDPNCTDCAEEDPYSYRIHVILPAYSSRFSNMDFRRFAEEVIRQETPAHILPRICWVSKEDMASLEKHYRDWIYLKAGAKAAQRIAKLKAFIEILFAVRNVYPPQKLHECDSPEDQPKFLLGQTTLGTMKE